MIASIAKPKRPKSEGASSRARIIVRINPSKRLVNLIVKTHSPPLTTLFERDSGWWLAMVSIGSMEERLEIVYSGKKAVGKIMTPSEGFT